MYGSSVRRAWQDGYSLKHITYTHRVADSEQPLRPDSEMRKED